MENQEQNQTATTMFNQAVDGSALQIRLNPEPLLTQIEMFLRGERLHYSTDQETGKLEVKKINCGEKVANEIGVQMILNLTSSIINTQTVQGNIEKDEQLQLIKDLKLDLSYDLMKNYKEWGIAKNNRRYIVRFIEKMCFLFVSRAWGNKERESYGQSLVQKISDRFSADNRKIQLDKV